MSPFCFLFNSYRAQNRLERDPDIHQCMVCKKFHSLRFCQQFLRMDSRERNRVVRKFRYCENCLARSHDLRSCQSLDLCRKCDSFHHTLLHPSRARNDLRRRINTQRNQQSHRTKNRPPNRRNNDRNTNRTNNSNNNVSNSIPNNNNRQSTNNIHNAVVPNQQILSEAIRSLAEVLCAQPSEKST